MEDSVWFPHINRSKGEKTLICFHHAGGNASIFYNWINKDNEIKVLPVETAGKNRRMKEEPIEKVNIVSECVAKEINKFYMGEDIYIFGHSLGAILAFKTTEILENQYGIYPRKLIIAGRSAPHKELSATFRSDMGEDALMEELRKNDFTPLEILNNKKYMDYFMPSILSDYRLNESFIYNNEMVNADIVAHYGRKDLARGKEVLKYWKEVTNGEFKLIEFEGDHFFVYKNNTYVKELFNEIKGYHNDLLTK